MVPSTPDPPPLHDLQERLEQALIDEYLRSRGYSSADPRLGEMPATERRLLMSQASAYASGKLAEVDARAHLVHELHGDVEEAHKPHR